MILTTEQYGTELDAATVLQIALHLITGTSEPDTEYQQHSALRTHGARRYYLTSSPVGLALLHVYPERGFRFRAALDELERAFVECYATPIVPSGMRVATANIQGAQYKCCIYVDRKSPHKLEHCNSLDVYETSTVVAHKNSGTPLL